MRIFAIVISMAGVWLSFLKKKKLIKDLQNVQYIVAQKTLQLRHLSIFFFIQRLKYVLE